MNKSEEPVAQAGNDASRKLFKPRDFDMCKGFMVGGHVHKPGCHSGYFYYTGCPYRWKFGEEEAKGFLITAHDLDTHQHYVHFQEIISKSYITISLDEIRQSNPKDLIEYINLLKKERGIDYLKIKFNIPVNGADKVILNNYYRNSPYTSLEFLDIEEQRRQQLTEQSKIDEQLSFLLQDKISGIEKYVRFVNYKEGHEFVTVEQLTEILSDKI